MSANGFHLLNGDVFESKYKINKELVDCERVNLVFDFINSCWS